MRLLLTGASGFLGSNIASIACQRGYQTHSVYNENKANFGIPIKINICNRNIIENAFNRIKPDVVIHAAAMTDVDECEKQRDLAREVNIEGTNNIISSSEKNRNFLIYVSTDYVFSGEKGRYKEKDTPDPINYYGLTKYKGEQIVSSSSIEWCIVRPSVIYGSNISPRKINFALWVLNELYKGNPINVVEDQWISPTLNKNLTDMILEIVERKLNGVYHLSGATEINRYKFALWIAETFDLDKSLIQPISSSELNWYARRPKNTSLNVEKASKILKNNPLTLKDALNKFKLEVNNRNILNYEVIK